MIASIGIISLQWTKQIQKRPRNVFGSNTFQIEFQIFPLKTDWLMNGKSYEVTFKITLRLVICKKTSYEGLRTIESVVSIWNSLTRILLPSARNPIAKQDPCLTIFVTHRHNLLSRNSSAEATDLPFGFSIGRKCTLLLPLISIKKFMRTYPKSIPKP